MNGGIGIIEMFKRTNLLALVGGGKNPRFPTNQIIIWDDHQGKIISKLRFNDNITSVRLRSNKIVAITKNKFYAFNMNTLETIGIIDTYDNPLGIIGISHGDNDKLIVAFPYESQGRAFLGDISKAQKAYDFLLEKFGKDIPFKIVEDSDARVSEICFYKNMDSNPLKELLKDFDVKVYDSGFALHLTDPEIDKGIGLAELAELLDYNIENIMCIGDSENDIDLLRAGGFKVAVANACDELKEIADYVCENKYGDGVAEAIDKFVFNQD